MQNDLMASLFFLDMCVNIDCFKILVHGRTEMSLWWLLQLKTLDLYISTF